MTQDVPSSRVASTDNGTVAESSSNIRRRLGNWTTTPAASGALAPQGSANATVPLAQGANANDTVELMTGSSPRSNDMMTVELQQAVPLHATAPMQAPHTQPFEAMNPAIKARLDQQAARSVSYHTAELHEEAAATAPFVSTTAPFAGETAPFPGGVTAPIPVDGIQTAAFTTPLAQPAETVPLPSQVDSTVALGASPDATVQLPGQQTVPIGTATVGLVNSPGYTSIMGSPDTADLAESGATVSLEIVEEIRGLRAALETNPGDPDLTMELALALNEAGERTEAHQILLRLHDLLQAAGDHEGANRIRTLLGDAVTAPIAADANPTQPMPRQTTDALKPRTGTLSLRAVPASRDGRIAKRQGNDYRERPAFAARDIPFFDPLPQIERVSGEAQRFFNAAEEDRERKRFRSALDNLQMATALDPTVPALFLRLAEVQLKLGFRRRALDTIHALDTFESLFRSGIPDWVFSRLQLHAEPFDLAKVQHLVDTM
ncbi:MAG: hypothetical protein M3Y37_04195, partial [Chloroflexota bacterium]|nr:hypothetical protein [Chloroflexota bacterium]